MLTMVASACSAMRCVIRPAETCEIGRTLPITTLLGLAYSPLP
jgi:hypothetical protein